MLEARALLDQIRTRRPREIVHVLLDVPMRGRAVPVVEPFLFAAGRADHPARRHPQSHVVHAVVGEELRAGVELARLPAVGLEHADLGKPLGEEEEVADAPGPRERARHPGLPLEIERDCLPRPHGLGQRDLEQRLVVHVAIVRGDVSHSRPEVGRGATPRAGQAQCPNLGPGPVPLPSVEQRLGRAGQDPLANPGRARVLPGVPVQVEAQHAGRVGRDVAPRDGLTARDHARSRIERGLDGVVGVAR